MSTEHPKAADHLIEDGLPVSYAAFVADLATTLDLTAGTADATHHATYAALTTDLATALDVDAGLADIIGPAIPPPPHSSLAPASYTAPASRHLSDQLRSLTHPQRLTFRSRPAYSMLRIALDSATRLARDLDNAVDLALARDLALASDLARALAVAVAVAVAVAADFDLAEPDGDKQHNSGEHPKGADTSEGC